MNYDEYGDPISGCHKRRLAKVTLYLEVPAVNSETETWYTEDELCKQIEEYTKPKTTPTLTYIKDNITSTSIAPDKGKPACRCTGCEFFDGYDMCCHHENFGSITQQSLDNCKKHNLSKEKLYGNSRNSKRDL